MGGAVLIYAGRLRRQQNESENFGNQGKNLLTKRSAYDIIKRLCDEPLRSGA